jgi:putative Mg2+ transporter-C (MgtC) family protein
MELTSLQADLIVIMRVLVAFILGGIIGWERERDGISAGIRTYGAISLGACVFGVISISMIGADPSRIAAQVATGIGFLCGGVIFRQGDYVVGLTTAATLWATSAVGLAISFGMYVIGIMTAVLIFILLYLPRLPWWVKLSRKMKLRVSSKKD